MQPRGDGDLADEVSEVAELIGYSQLEWQRDVTASWSTYDERGQWVHRRCGASVPRQAGKSVDGIVWTTFLVAMMGYSVLWTDHNYSTACEMLRRFQKIFGKNPRDPWGIRAFNSLVRRFNSKTAQEAFELSNGGVLAFSTRTKSAALGYSFDVVVYDEAQELTGEQMQAIIPTTSSGPHGNTQSIFLGTPTRAGSPATKFMDMRSEAIGGHPADDLCWFEWGVPEVGDIFDERRWYEVNPSLAEGRADLDAIRTGIRALGKTDELAAAQEYLGYWLPQATADTAIATSAWAMCAVPSFPPEGDGETVAYGVKYSPDGRRAALCACCRRDGLDPHVELVLEGEAHQMTGEIARRALEASGRVSEVLVDGRAGASDLMDEMRELGVPRRMRRLATTGDAIDSAVLFEGAVSRGRLTHLGGPGQELLDAAATTSARRRIGRDGWGFDGPVAHVVEAAALALLAAKTAKRNPGRKLRIG